MSEERTRRHYSVKLPPLEERQLPEAIAAAVEREQQIWAEQLKITGYKQRERRRLLRTQGGTGWNDE